jgi:hypothetical protein
MMIRSLLGAFRAVRGLVSPSGGGAMSTSLATSEAELTAVPRNSGMEVLDPGKPEDRAAWLDLWNRWPGREVMAHPDYVRLFARPCDRVVALAWRGEDGGILYPLIVRPLASEPWGAAGGRGCDLITAYGYGGPFAWNVTEEDTRAYWARFDEWARDQKAVTSFDRLSLFPEQLLPFNGEVEAKGSNIIRRLDIPEADLWSDYASKVRQNVNRARRLGLRFEPDPSGERLDEFMAIYNSTMARRNASREYFHPRSFFESIIRDLAGHFSFFHLSLNGKAISSELVLLSENSSYSFLGGSLKEAFELRGNDLFKHEIITWCRRAGKKVIVLGGGYRGSDGILAFKKSFAPNGEVTFRVGKRTFDQALSTRMTEERRSWEKQEGRDWTSDPQYFPVYRA